MSRPNYESEKDRENERQIAEAFAMFTRTTAVRMGGDKPPADFAHIREIANIRLVVGLTECKERSHRFNLQDTWKVSAKKIETLRGVAIYLRLPVCCVVRFGCGTIGFLDVCKQSYTVDEHWGRDDRGDPADKERAACFKWTQFTVIKEGLPREHKL